MQQSARARGTPIDPSTAFIPGHLQLLVQYRTERPIREFKQNSKYNNEQAVRLQREGL
jgi:hypothetical protein